MKKIILFSLFSLLAICLMFYSTNKNVYAQSDPPYQTTITLSGSGQVFVTPDVATVTVGVETLNEDIEQANTENSQTMARIIQTLKDSNIVDENIKTVNFNIYKKYNYENSKQSFVGYQITNTLTFKTDDLDNIGAILSKLTSAGANIFQGINLSVNDNSQAYCQALTLALNDAYLKLTSLIEDVENYKVIKITEESGYMPVVKYLDSNILMKASLESSVPVMKGEMTTTATVKVIFAK